MQVQLTDRQQHILWATVRHYIATAEPVGSKALVEENLGVSPATFAMRWALEKLGYSTNLIPLPDECPQTLATGFMSTS